MDFGVVKWNISDRSYKPLCITNVENHMNYFADVSSIQDKLCSFKPGDFVLCDFSSGNDMLARNVILLEDSDDIRPFEKAFFSFNLKLAKLGLKYIHKRLRESNPSITNQILAIIENESDEGKKEVLKYVPLTYGGTKEIISKLSPVLKLEYFLENSSEDGIEVIEDLVQNSLNFILTEFFNLEALPESLTEQKADSILKLLTDHRVGGISEFTLNLLKFPLFIDLVFASSLFKKVEGLIDVTSIPILDNFFQMFDLENQQTHYFIYMILRRTTIRQYLVDRLGIHIDEEQLNAISSASQNILVAARAGSGKTSTVINKLIEIVELEKVDPSKVVILTFNKKAALEVTNRAVNFFDFSNAYTFHAFSRRILGGVDLLTPALDDEAIDEQETIIDEIINNEMPKDFLKHMYLFFKHYFDLDSRKESLTDLQYYSFRRNLTYVSLAGNEVKSVGEKIIADYLWEHGISFKYEKTFKWKNGMYRPDFYFEINNKKYVIEHWAINPDKETNSILENGINPKKYKEQIISKRKYWEFLAKKDPEYILIETHNDEVIGGRKAFENILKERLQSFGVVLTRLSDVEKINLLKKNHSRRITKLFLDFIKKAKKKNYTIVDLNAITSKPNYAETSDARTRTFHYYGKLIFEKYVETLANLRKSDFEDLLIESINEVRNSGSKAKFIDSTNQTVNLCDIEYLLIDEFQDFNELNFQLISEIKALNPKLKLFCVGDNWQAINGFAGSDTSFFEKFEELFPNADTLLISTNYRSESRIVELGNMLMFGEGAPAKSKHSIISGKVYQKYINYIEFDTFNEKDKVYLLNGDNDYIVSRYIKYIIEVLISNTGKHITILSRTNSIYGFDFQTLKKKILQITKRGYDSVIFETAKNMEFSTVHAYKGLEADIIVILDVLEGRFPLFHQDTVLFEIFGQNLPQAYKEEKRLFYVAISRPKEKLFIVTQSDRPSEFLSNIKFDSKEQ